VAATLSGSTAAIPVFETVYAGVMATIQFVKAYPRLLIFAALVYAGSAALSILLLPRLHLAGSIEPYLVSWFASLPGVVVLAPVWTALNRFVILGDRNRRILDVDLRVRRVLVVLLALSFIAMLGGAPFALIFDFPSRLIRRRTLAWGIIGVAGLIKLAERWLSFRLAIAPAMAAAGTRKRPLDTAFAYTGGAVFRITGVKLVIYLPLFAMIATLKLTGGLAGGLQTALLAPPAIVSIVTVLAACTELVDAATMARIALRLAGRHAAAAKTAAAATKATAS
jgi:hypothetical protein